jgi:general stress protein 26
MANTQQHESSEVRTLEDLFTGDRHVAMIMTMIGESHSSRPVTCLAVRDGRLSFLVSRSTEWASAIEDGRATVHLTVADEKAGLYLSLNGTAQLSQDRQEIDRLWNPYAAVYFEGQHDPEVAVLQFDPSGGQYWESADSKIGRAVSLVQAAITGERADLGASGPVAPPADGPAQDTSQAESPTSPDADAPGAFVDDYASASIPEPNEPG